MFQINQNYLKLKDGYLFPEIGRRVRDYSQKNSTAKIIRLGIGDVTQPLPQVCVDAAKKAFDEMTKAATFRGYGPEQGYDFLREAIAQNDYRARGVDISPDEIFVSDGAKCDIGNFQEILGADCVVAIPDPVYPVYADTNVMAGRSERLVYLPCTPQTNFLPELPKQKVDVIYLCFPNNPTGVVATKDELKKWVDYARENQALILFDAAYESFIEDPSIPHSIFEIEGAKECAVEFRSFSKTAGFTGVRCAYTVVPRICDGRDGQGGQNGQGGKGNVPLRALWLRRQTTKFNGVAYPVQRSAEAVYTKEGRAQCKELIDYYKKNARLIFDGLQRLGFEVFGGLNAPYVWFKTHKGVSSWDFFDQLLNKTCIVGTPGAGFGPCGEGFMRFSAFGNREEVTEAIERMKKL